MTTPPELIDQIRGASRTMVRELGFMRATLAGTQYSPSAVHTLLEIEAHGVLAAARLVQLLDLEKSSVSRMVAKLIKAGELEESAGVDGRVKRLQLTKQGKRTVAAIHVHSQQQVQLALKYLNPSQQQAVAQGLTVYAQSLHAHRTAADPTGSATIEICTGYRPGVVGRITEMHAAFYSRYSGFGQFFESRVASGLAEFVGRLDQPCNQIWLAIMNDRIVGSIAIDGQDMGDNQAHLRWFILDDGCRGSGVGRRLLAEAVAFSDRQGFDIIELSTFKGLDAARQLYESAGFVLSLEEQGSQWGSVVTEQQFTRRRANLR